ncbi:MAG TPA: 5'-nucleotidase [Methylomirabilota bacterium]|nr:5'-nucleotidase [Methylomirabilota bacterium]
MAGRFLQTAGLTCVVDPARPSGSRIGAVTVAGQPLAVERRYRVAVPDYLARGGDDYDMLARGRAEVTARRKVPASSTPCWGRSPRGGSLTALSRIL